MIDDGSILRDGLKLWTPALIDELDQRFVRNFDAGEGDFFEKLKAQLSEGSADCRKLMAEILWIMMLFQSNVSAAKKRENVLLVWSWSGDKLPEDHPMLTDTALEGLGSAGTAYNTHRWREIAFLISALRDFKHHDHTERQAMLNDPWSFTKWLSSLPEAQNRQLRHILPHLLFPDSFERISSAKEKRLIIAAFDGVTEKELRKWEPIKIDQALLDLRRRLETQHSGEIDFYEDELSSTWRNSAKSWLLSWNPKNWQWTTLAADRASTSAGEVVTHSWRCGSSAPREGDHAFLVRTGIDPKGIVAFGLVARAPYDAPHYDPEKATAGQTTQFIDVDFTEIRDASLDPVLPLETLEREAPDQTWNPQSSGIEIKPKAARKLSRLWQELATPQTVRAIKVSDITEPLNLILYGPPGTGKTYRLQQTYMPRYADKEGDRFEFITFHQSYAYEDTGHAFRLRPDITVLDDSGVVRIFDAKWKLLDPKAPSYGVSPSDVYQLAAYAGRYRCERVALVYPASVACRAGLVESYRLAIPGAPILEIHAVNVQELAHNGSLPPELRPPLRVDRASSQWALGLSP